MNEEMLPTVTVIRDGNPVRINASDYDPKVDKLAKGEPAPKAPEPVAEPAMAAEPTQEPTVTADPVQLGLVKKGRRYFVVNAATSEPVELDGIDADGYTTEDAAIAAAQAAMAG